MSLGRLFKRTLRDPVEGAFRVTGVSVAWGDDGHGIARLSGVLSGPGIAARAVQVDRTYLPGEPVAEQGAEFPAMIDRSRPSRYEIGWPQRDSVGMQALWDNEHARRVAAALRLGLDASVVPRVTGTSIRDLATAQVEQRYARDLLPDDNRPVSTEEAIRLYTSGVPATATITGIDFLPVPKRSMPGPEASIANVAVRVERSDGTFGWHRVHDHRTLRLSHGGASRADRR